MCKRDRGNKVEPNLPRRASKVRVGPRTYGCEVDLRRREFSPLAESASEPRLNNEARYGARSPARGPISDSPAKGMPTTDATEPTTASLFHKLSLPKRLKMFIGLAVLLAGAQCIACAPIARRLIP